LKSGTTLLGEGGRVRASFSLGKPAENDKEKFIKAVS